MLGTTLTVLLVLIALSVPIAAVLGVLALSLGQFFSVMPLHLALGDVMWENSIEFLLIAIPLFILMGEILLRSGIAERMYGALAQWLSWLPGGLMHSNVGSCALFAATSGSSVATAATIGTVALPEVDRHRYDERLFVGTLAAGGTLGILIPPSINLIIHGLLTDTSVPPALPRGVRSRTAARGAVHGDGGRRLPVPPRLGRNADRDELGDAGAKPRAPAPTARHLPRRGGVHLRRARHPHRSSLPRRGRVTRAGSVRPFAQPGDAAPGRGGHDAHHRDGDAHHPGRDLPELRARRHRTDPGALAVRPGAGPHPDADAAGGDRVLPGARLLHGDALHAAHHHAPHRADHRLARLRPGVVRDPDDGDAGDRAHHPADRGQPLRRAGGARPGLDERRHHRNASVRRHHVRDDRAAGPVSGARAVAAGALLSREGDIDLAPTACPAAASDRGTTIA